MKFNKDFFNKNKVSRHSAANLFYFSIDAMESDIFEQFKNRLVENGMQIPDTSAEAQYISELYSSEDIVNYMRKIKSIANTPKLINKVLMYESETMPLIIRRFLTNSTDIFIETAGKCFIKADIKYIYDLYQQYDNIRSLYAKAMICLVLGVRGIESELDFIYHEYVKMKTEYPQEPFWEFPLLALHILRNN